MEQQGVIHGQGNRGQHNNQDSRLSNNTSLTTYRYSRGTPGVQSCHHSSRMQMSKTRWDRWQQSNTTKHLKDKYRAFHKGYSKFRKSLEPSHQDLSRASQKNATSWHDNHHYNEPQTGCIPQEQVAAAMSQESLEMRRTMEFLKDGGVGFMPDMKASGWV